MGAATVRIGFIGAGGIARQRHLPGLRKIDGVELVAVANRRRESAEQVAREYGFRVVLDDWRQILEMPEIDAVFIATPPFLHRDTTVAALEAGKHVFCQARMARDLAEARAMHDAAARHPAQRAMLCPPPHALEADYLVKRLLAEGTLGELRDVQVHGISGMYADPTTPLHWRQDADVSGFNTMNLGMYAEVLNRWVGGHRRITAHTKVFTRQRPRPDTGELAEVRIADSLGILTEMANGALSAWHLSGVSRHPQPHRFELYGSAGTIHVVMPTILTVEVLAARTGEALSVRPIPAELRRVWRAEADFIDAIRLGTPISPDFDEGLAYMEFTEAVYRSAATGQTVILPLPD